MQGFYGDYVEIQSGPAEMIETPRTLTSSGQTLSTGLSRRCSVYSIKPRMPN